MIDSDRSDCGVHLHCCGLLMDLGWFFGGENKSTLQWSNVSSGNFVSLASVDCRSCFNDSGLELWIWKKISLPRTPDQQGNRSMPLVWRATTVGLQVQHGNQTNKDLVRGEEHFLGIGFVDVQSSNVLDVPPIDDNATDFTKRFFVSPRLTWTLHYDELVISEKALVKHLCRANLQHSTAPKERPGLHSYGHWTSHRQLLPLPCTGPKGVTDGT